MNLLKNNIILLQIPLLFLIGERKENNYILILSLFNEFIEK
jgi:hypothetical protein